MKSITAVTIKILKNFHMRRIFSKKLGFPLERLLSPKNVPELNFLNFGKIYTMTPESTKFGHFQQLLFLKLNSLIDMIEERHMPKTIELKMNGKKINVESGL